MISIGLSLLAVKWLDIHIRSDRPSITVHSVLRASRRFPPPSLPPFPSSFSTPGETANQSPPPSSSWSTKLSCGQASPTPSSTPRRRQSNRFLKIHNRGTNEAFGLFLPPSLPPSTCRVSCFCLAVASNWIRATEPPLSHAKNAFSAPSSGKREDRLSRASRADVEDWLGSHLPRGVNVVDSRERCGSSLADRAACRRRRLGNSCCGHARHSCSVCNTATFCRHSLIG